ncbi:MAG TPA: hypothetical protein PLD23_02535 [Armatimonadota bacterium]|nr:hypothetical protein [Armatimonadota bacterium]
MRGSMGLLVALGFACLAGCGAGPDGGDGGPEAGTGAPGDTTELDLGSVRIEAASGIKRLDLPVPDSAEVCFTGYYGAAITRLAEMGPGRLLVSFYPNDGQDYDLWTVDPTKGFASRLASWASSEYNPCWSPDGTKLAFASNMYGSYDIFHMKSTGSSATRITTQTSSDNAPCWSPDSAKIAFETNRTGTWDVYEMRSSDGANPKALAATAGDERSPAWSPNGNYVAISHNPDRSSGGSDIWVVPYGYTTGWRNLTEGATVDDDSPAWSPDGTRIAWSRCTGSDWNIWVMDADGGNKREIVATSASETHPTWSPDGNYIAYQHMLSVRVVRVDDPSDSRELTPSYGASAHPDWCRAPQAVRSLIGPAGSDWGASPPFGTGQGLMILGLSESGLAEAVGLDIPSAYWSGIAASGVPNTGSRLVGALVEAAQIDGVREDAGPGTRPIYWSTASSPVTTSVLMLFSASTGKVVTVLPSTTKALAAAAGVPRVTARVDGGRVILRGAFGSVLTAGGTADMAPQGAQRVELDAGTGEVLEAS